MGTFYLIIVVMLFILAISDLVVGVSNDAVNFLNSAIGSKAGTFKLIMGVAALGIIVGCTFSSGMMEVARKGIFHPQNFYFSEIILIFLAVMITDVILLDAFNTLGMPTSTTVSIVFELLGAAVAISIIKISIDPNALGLGEYINSDKALAIISGILLSVVIAFTAGVIVQYLTRLIFSFDYEKKMKYLGAIWGGLAIAAITYFMLVKGSKGASFMTDGFKALIANNSLIIIAISFVFWALVLQLLILFTKVDILKFIVIIGTFALAMAFAGNDLVNFVGVPLAGYNSYELYTQSGGAGADSLLMTGLAGQVPTPTVLLLLAGVIMTITLWTSKKARSVVQTSLDLGRQYEGSERFASYALSRSVVRNLSKASAYVNERIPAGLKKTVETQFDQRPFTAKQAVMGAEAPVFDMLRAAVTLVVASILIAIGTNLKLPLSTTYVTFMVFMGTSLADGAWGRESAVYRVSGVLSVIGGWFFTALSAFTVAFIFAGLFYFGGPVAIVLSMIGVGFIIYHTHRYHGRRVEEQAAFDKSLEAGEMSGEKIIELSLAQLEKFISNFNTTIEHSLQGLASEDLARLSKAYNQFKKTDKEALRLRKQARKASDQMEESQIEDLHLYMLVIDYLHEMSQNVSNIIRPSLSHVDNHHKPLLPVQIEELRSIHELLKDRLAVAIRVFKEKDTSLANKMLEEMQSFVEAVRAVRKRHIKRIKNHEVGTRNSMLYLNHLAEFRNLALFSNRIVKVFDDLMLNAVEEKTALMEK